MPLTELEVKAAKTSDKILKLSDGGGLQLWVHPTGAKRWRFAYRHGGKQKILAIGVYPAVSLKAAREKREESKALLASGIDPAQQRKTDRIEKALTDACTFSVVALEWLDKAKREGKAGATLKKMTWLLETLASPEIGNRPIADITPPEVLEVLRKVEIRGKLHSAHRLRSTIRNLCGQYARRHGFPFTWIWVWEIETDGKGEHMHFLCHVPVKLRTRLMANALTWLPSPNAIHARYADYRQIIARDGKQHDMALYLAKQMAPQASYGRKIRRKKGGTIYGKRWGCSSHLQRPECPLKVLPAAARRVRR